ncbi:MAG TPA: large conductance mechanosensitive channel protein MscL [Clostridiales bacterium]|nr:large conductance mechanosensitive channel protein MscL [Clostridiales bacterium]
MWKEFKQFAVKGNIIDMAMGIIIGSAFSKIVSSLVNDMIMPIFSLIIGRIDFTNLFIALDGKHYEKLGDAKEAAVSTINYGMFISAIIDFLIIAFSLFLIIRNVNKLKKKEEAPPAEPTAKVCPYCQSTISIKATRCPQCTSELVETMKV